MVIWLGAGTTCGFKSRPVRSRYRKGKRSLAFHPRNAAPGSFRSVRSSSVTGSGGSSVGR